MRFHSKILITIGVLGGALSPWLARASDSCELKYKGLVTYIPEMIERPYKAANPVVKIPARLEQPESDLVVSPHVASFFPVDPEALGLMDGAELSRALSRIETPLVRLKFAIDDFRQIARPTTRDFQMVMDQLTQLAPKDLKKFIELYAGKLADLDSDALAKTLLRVKGTDRTGKIAISAFGAIRNPSASGFNKVLCALDPLMAPRQRFIETFASKIPDLRGEALLDALRALPKAEQRVPSAARLFASLRDPKIDELIAVMDLIKKAPVEESLPFVRGEISRLAPFSALQALELLDFFKELESRWTVAQELRKRLPIEELSVFDAKSGVL